MVFRHLRFWDINNLTSNFFCYLFLNFLNLVLVLGPSPDQESSIFVPTKQLANRNGKNLTRQKLLKETFWNYSCKPFNTLWYWAIRSVRSAECTLPPYIVEPVSKMILIWVSLLVTLVECKMRLNNVCINKTAITTINYILPIYLG